jgi:hypothetical protein
MQPITLQKLIEQIQFHGKNISIKLINSNFNVLGIRIYSDRLELDCYSYSNGAEEIQFTVEDNEEIIPSSDGVYHLYGAEQDEIYGLQFFLAVSNLAETSQ